MSDYATNSKLGQFKTHEGDYSIEEEIFKIIGGTLKEKKQESYNEVLSNKILIQELRDTIDNQREEIDRLNNIINEYRIGIENMWVDNAGEDTWIYNGKDLSREEFLDKLKELKENNK